MMDWRTVLCTQAASQNTQNPQNGMIGMNSEDFGDFEYGSRNRLGAPQSRLMTDNILIEPASPVARNIYWEQADGRIIGGGKPELLAMVGSGPTTTFWVVATYQGHPRWLRADRLRSHQAYLAQAEVGEVEPIRF